MPRKYRPPAAKRRKTKKPASSSVVAAPLEPENGATPLAEEDDAALDEETAFAEADEYEDDFDTTPQLVGRRREGRAEPIRHVSRDYSYVRGEIVRILAIVAFLVTSLVITSFFR